MTGYPSCRLPPASARVDPTRGNNAVAACGNDRSRRCHSEPEGDVCVSGAASGVGPGMKITRFRLILAAALSVAPLAAAVPAGAATRGVDSHCGTYICVMTAHQNKFVQDITVYAEDGLPGTLRAYWGEFRSPRVSAASASGRWATSSPTVSSAAAWSATAAPSRTTSSP